MRNCGLQSHEDGYWFEENQYETYQEVCVARGLLADGDEAVLAFEEAMLDSSPSQLRFFFVSMTIQGYPTIQIYKKYQDELMADFRNVNEFLQDLEKRFNSESKDMTKYGLPKPLETNTLLQQTVAMIDPAISQNKLDALHVSQPNTNEMSILYDEITNAIDNQSENDQVRFFGVDAMGGSGKSTFAKKIFHYANAQNKIALGGAASGLACQVYGDLSFETLHTLFSIPVIEDEEEFDNIDDIRCNLNKSPQRVELVNASDVMILDEVFSNHKHCLHAIMRDYNKLRGKIVLLLMDRGQTGPVVKRGSRTDTVAATMLSLPLWSTIRMATFTKNLRLLAMSDTNAQDPHYIRQVSYAKVLTEIRTNGPFDLRGPIHVLYTNDITGEKKFVFDDYKYFTDMKLAVEFLYPDGYNTLDKTKRAILAPTNKQCDEWNKVIQDMNPNPTITLLSSNEFADVDDPHGVLNSMLNSDTLEYYTKPGVPVHSLNLKVGDIGFLLRTISKKYHLSRNTRVKFVTISRRRIVVQTLDDNPKLYSIPRIRFRINHNSGFTLLRTQFPFVLAYATTKNKAQGQGLLWSLNDIRQESFSHGQEYVAMSRPFDIDQVAVFCTEDQIVNDSPVFSNIVYNELFI